MANRRPIKTHQTTIVFIIVALTFALGVVVFYCASNQSNEVHVLRNQVAELSVLLSQKHEEVQEQHVQRQERHESRQEQQQQPAVRVAIDPNAGGSPPGTYPQIGYVTIEGEGHGQTLPLYGRRSEARRGRWYYYTIISGGIKVPVVSHGRDCMDEVACDELYDGEKLAVKDGGSGTVRIYKFDRV